MRIPRSTYRLQIRAEFDLTAAAAVADYVARARRRLDVLLADPARPSAAPTHGYDVVDHSMVDPARGGAEGLDAAAKAARELGLGVLVDIVPNHVGVATPMESVVVAGPAHPRSASRYAEAFDIDWEFGGGKVRIPVLGDEAEPELPRRRRRAALPRPSLPARARARPTTTRSPADVHARQHYELINWRRADAELNYRRFFAVNTLAGIRVEVPWVFDESHVEIVRWIRDGLADGLRVDHPDGLADPGGYLDALAAATGGTYVLVEKILEGDEQLPASWATAGTTGYDALADIDRVLVDPTRPAARSNALDARLHDGAGPVSWAQLIHDTKREIADGILRAEVLRLERDIGSAVPRRRRRTVSRSPMPSPSCSPASRCTARTCRSASSTCTTRRARPQVHRPDLSATIDAVVAVLADVEHPASIRFQQTSGMVMAKGVEDTAFYRYSRLGSLTEVGADPAEFSIDVDEFHRRQQLRQASLPDVADHAVDPRHQARRGRPGPHQRARRGARRVGADVDRAARARSRSTTARSSNCSGRRSSERGRRRANGCTRTPRRRRARRGPRPAGRTRPRTSSSGMHRPRRQRVRRPAGGRADRSSCSARSRMPGWINSLSAKLHPADRARRSRRLPGQRAVGDVARRSRQPPPGRLRAAAPPARRPRRAAPFPPSTRPEPPSCS